MRAVHYNDVLAAVSYLAACASDKRSAALARLFHEAEVADRYRRRHCAAHPVFGDGTLMAAALRHGQRGDVSFQTADSLECWIMVLRGLQDRLAQPEAQLMQRVTVGSNSSRFAAMSSPQSSQ